jgi:hypothetical protein
MQSSFNKSQQLNYSNCKLSPIMFYPDTIHRDKSDFFNIDNRNRVTFLQSSMISGKMGIVEPNLSNQFYAKLKNMATPLGEYSIMNSKKSGKENSQKREDTFVKKIMPTFELPWNTRNISFNSNQNFKMTNNFGLRTNQNSAFRSHNLGRNFEAFNKNSTPESRISSEINHNQTNNNIHDAGNNFVSNNISKNKPQVFSSILKARKAEHIIYKEDSISIYNNVNNGNFQNNNNYKNNNDNENYLRNNLNLTIINNNNYNLKNVVKKRKTKAGKARNQTELSEISSCEKYNQKDDWKPTNNLKRNNKCRNLERKVKTNKQRSKEKNNWKKVIEICRGIFSFIYFFRGR